MLLVMRRRHHFACALSLVLAIAAAPMARSAMVTIHFSGYITDVSLGEFNHLPELSIGDPFSGSYAYDDGAEDPFGSTTHQEYRLPWISLKATVGGEDYELNEQAYITASALQPGAPIDEGNTEVYAVNASKLGGEDSLFARLDVTGEIFDQLPDSLILRDLPLPSLSQAHGRFSLAAPPSFVISPPRCEQTIGQNGQPMIVCFPPVLGGGSGFDGVLTSLTMPEPSNTLLMALALALIAIQGWRRGTKGR